MFRLMTLTVVLVAAAACGGSSSSTTTPTNAGGTTVTPLHGTMTASIDGSAWTAVAISTATYGATGTHTITSGVFNITF